MAFYKCYLLDEIDRIKHVEAIECGDDESARAQAAELLRRYPELRSIVLWNGARRVPTA